jgi:DNA-binding response OmpR family regulator
MKSFERPHLAGATILIVEDEYFLANELAKTLRAEGAEILGPAPSVEAAERLLDQTRPDCALVDMNLRGAPGAALVKRLDEDGVRFAVLSGYDRATLPPEIDGAPYIEKPATAAAVTDVVFRLIDRARTPG